MKSVLTQLRRCFEVALSAAFGDAGSGVDPQIRAATDPKFGDYQSNVAMGLAKKLGLKPRDAAAKIVAALPADATNMIDPPEIAGPGFINLRLKPDFLRASLESIPPAPAAEPTVSATEQARSASEGSAAPASPDPTLSISPGFDRVGIEPVADADRRTVVIDYSSPNVAKQMHVGHLRSTIIGDTLARVIKFQGHTVIRQNHLGDWGTQFGIVIAEAREAGIIPPHDPANAQVVIDPRVFPHDPEGWEAIYKKGQAKMGDPEFAQRARNVVVRLQRGDLAERLVWSSIVRVTHAAGIKPIYSRLGVHLTINNACGESFYNPLLPSIVEELRAALQPCDGASEQSRDREGAVADASGVEAGPLPHGRGSDGGAASLHELRAVCREDQGAICVFLEKPDGTPAFKGPEGDPLPMLIQKSDGAYLYSTTDLAAIAYRINAQDSQPIRFQRADAMSKALQEVVNQRGPYPPHPEAASRRGLGATRILYVVGAPQKLHFEMLFATARALGWTRPGNRQKEVELQHVPFGSVLGEDRKMLRTRSGESVKLKDLLDEAVQRAEKLVRETEADPGKRRGFTNDEIKHIAETVGIAAVKYADLCQNRNTDYVFSWDKMLALQGNTAPYMLYAYARIRSIYRKGEEKQSAVSGQQSAITLVEAAERALALAILRLPETIEAVADSLLPNILCDYLYDLAGRFMNFYESCPVLQAPNEATKASRLRLCDLTARALRLGLALLGIRTLERM